MPTILLTGGAGYIGSHTCVEVLAAGWKTVIVDNLSNSSPIVIDRIADITGARPAFVQADIRDRAALDRVFAAQRIDAVIHFAGLKAVGESVAQPLRYYDNNVAGTLVLIEAMRSARRAEDRLQLVGHRLRARRDDAARRERADSARSTPMAAAS